MNRLSDVLTILLKRIPIRSLINNEIQSTHLKQETLSEIFLPYMSGYSDTELWHFISALEDKLRGYEAFNGDVISESINLFQVIFMFADDMLTEQENEVVCKFEKLLQWRKVVSQISEVTFVIAYMVRKDAAEGIKRKVFSHKPVITHNNVQLKMILNHGFSENHFHLMGSAPYFQLSWVRLMNKPSDRQIEKRLRSFDNKRRSINIHYNEGYQEEAFATRVKQAFLIRLYLFSRLKQMPLKLHDYQMEVHRLKLDLHKWKLEDKYQIDSPKLLEIWKAEGTEGLEKSKKSIIELLKAVWNDNNYYAEFMEQYPEIYNFLKEALNVWLPCPETGCGGKPVAIVDLIKYFLKHQEKISLCACRELLSEERYHSLYQESTLKYLRYLLSNEIALEMKISDFQSIVSSLKSVHNFLDKDYAILLSDYEWYDKRGGYVDLWGERVFLYQCFQRIDQDGWLFSEYESNLFYAYLVIKESIRSEMVQANEYVGFENFQIHQDRKEYFSDGVNFEKSMARMAVRDTLQSQSILHLEARITPGLSVQENLKKIRFYDNAIDDDGEMGDKFYYVFHFIKSQDKKTEFMECRHFEKRRDILRRAYALEEFRVKYPSVAARVLGIDAASQEIGCRPEVFGVVFRGLKSHMHDYISGHIREKKLLPQLRASYHVGEDFLDVLDGLRAIDEAIMFLGLGYGDRLGHALALGIDVDEWYASKGNQLSIFAQDYLDNIVWLYSMLIRYKVDDRDNLKAYLESEFSYYFGKIYGGVMNQASMDAVLSKVCCEVGMKNELYHLYRVERRILQIDIYTYFNAWKLRGDEPQLYKKGFFDGNEQVDSGLRKHEVNFTWPEDFTLRYVPEVAYLYHLYHFSDMVKQAGRREVIVRVDARIRNVVRIVQKKMQEEIADRGIGIETNPSSNYMIGTFKRYDKHPIISFYNKGLVTDENRLKGCPQIWCSINTDDQGVFSASLENEYALMAGALESVCDESGQRIYNKAMIYEWIDNIRINGNLQSFGSFREKLE